jgi:hypothetical protein
METEEWMQAFLCFQKVQQLESGYRDTEWLLSRVQRELTAQTRRRTELFTELLDQKFGSINHEGGNLARQIPEQLVVSAQDFYGDSLGRLKSRLQGDRFLLKQVPQWERHVQIQEMASNYAAIEDSIDRVAQIVGVQDTTNQAAQRARGDAAQQMPEQTLESALSFYGDSLGRLKDQLRSERSNLIEIWETLSDSDASTKHTSFIADLEELYESTRAIIQDMIDYYTLIEDSLDQAAQDLGVEGEVN